MRESKIKGYAVNFGNTIGGLIRKGWWEIPEVMGATCLGLVGIIIGSIGAYNYIMRNGESREYRLVYVIMRPDDLRVPGLKNPVCTEFK